MDRDAARQYFATGFWCMASISIVLSLVAAVVVYGTGLASIVFALYVDEHAEILRSLGLVVAIFFLSANLTSIESPPKLGFSSKRHTTRLLPWARAVLRSWSFWWLKPRPPP